MSDREITFRYDLDDTSSELIFSLCSSYEDRIRSLIQDRAKHWHPSLRQDSDCMWIRNDEHWQADSSKESDAASNRIKDSLKVHVVVSADDENGLNKALHSNAPGLQIDLDDAHCPSWNNTIRVQNQLKEFINSESCQASSPVLGFRPRSLHIPDDSILYRGQPISGSIVDMALFFANNHLSFAKNGFLCDPVLYLPKVECYEEAVLWADMIACIEQYFPALKGHIKTIAMMENIKAAFQIEEIIFALRKTIIAMNLGKFDYVFSFIKKFPDKVLPPRSKISTQPFMQGCLSNMVSICFKRGVVPTTGMASSISSSKSNLQAAYDAKKAEASLGSYGGLVAHLDFVDTVRDAFTEIGSPQAASIESFSQTTPYEDTITTSDVAQALRVSLQVCQSWINETGVAVVDGFMEDLATAEVCRSLVWQWCRAKRFDLESAIQIVQELCQAENCSAAGDIVIAAIQQDPILPYLTDLLLPIVQANKLASSN